MLEPLHKALTKRTLLSDLGVGYSRKGRSGGDERRGGEARAYHLAATDSGEEYAVGPSDELGDASDGESDSEADWADLNALYDKQENDKQRAKERATAAARPAQGQGSGRGGRGGGGVGTGRGGGRSGGGGGQGGYPQRRRLPQSARLVRGQVRFDDPVLQKRWEDKTCLLCGQPDHRAAQCPKREPTVAVAEWESENE